MGALDAFVDTAGFVSLWDAGDDHHDRTVELQAELIREGRRFLTTDRHFERGRFVPLRKI